MNALEFVIFFCTFASGLLIGTYLHHLYRLRRL